MYGFGLFSKYLHYNAGKTSLKFKVQNLWKNYQNKLEKDHIIYTIYKHNMENQIWATRTPQTMSMIAGALEGVKILFKMHLLSYLKQKVMHMDFDAFENYLEIGYLSFLVITVIWMPFLSYDMHVVNCFSHVECHM